MRKRDELSDPNSCLSKALDDELMFNVLCRDPAGPETVRAWINLRIEMGLNQSGDPELIEAEHCAQRMGLERSKIRAILGKSPR
jgi:hypothetical protein